MEKPELFLKYISNQLSQSQALSISQLIERVEGIENIYLIFVDLLQGFCEEGPLASQIINEVVKPVSELCSLLLDKGLPTSNLIFLNDSHLEDAVEFNVFPPHCIKGTAESQVVSNLDIYHKMKGTQTFYKNATSGLFGKNSNGEKLFEWLENIFSQKKSLFILVGDCTDLCIYQNAMGIRLLANQKNALAHVIVPQDLVRTYDLPIETANKLGVLAHDFQLMNLFFLYHMKLNGIDVPLTINKE